MKKDYSIAIALFLILLYSSGVFGQGKNSENPLYNWFDEQVGIESTDIYSGIEYWERYKMNNEKTKFFLSAKLLPGSIVYNRQPYSNLELKYDAYEDVVLIGLQQAFGGRALKLINDQIDSFTIAGHDFVNINGSDAKGNMLFGFYEVSVKSSLFTLFTKHKKNLSTRLNSESVYHEFTEAKKAFVLWYRNVYYSIDQKRDVTRVFPEYKAEVNSFYKTSRSLRKKDSFAFTKALMDKIATSISQKNNGLIE